MSIATNGETLLKIPGKSSFMFNKLTKHVNYVLENGKLPNWLKINYITPAHKNNDPTKREI